MKKIILLIPFLILASMNVGVAQEMKRTKKTSISGFKKGQVDLNLGLGIIPLLDPSIAIDFAVSDNFSVGAMGAYGGQHSFLNSRDIPQQLTAYSMGLRLITHYTELEKVDWYGGLMLGYKFNAQEIHQDLEKVFPGIFTCIFGSRIRINEHIGVYTELSYTGYSFVSMGVNIRI